MDNYSLLREFYKKNYSKLIFKVEKVLSNNVKARMFCYNYENEIDSFTKVFNNYLPYYVDNHDSLIYYNLNEDIEEELNYWSKRLWKDSVMITRKNIKTTGIFGELFLDFLMRIVEEKELVLTYASKKAYSDNNEIKGIDSVLVGMDQQTFEIYACEAKFVQDLTSAHDGLCSDINGENNHVNKSVLNDYIGGFALKKQESVSNQLKKTVKDSIAQLNIKLITERESFIDAINQLNYKMRFVYFAIYKSTKKEPENIREKYESILEAFNTEIINTGINNYEVDVILIPTNNMSMTLKQSMVEIYD